MHIYCFSTADLIQAVKFCLHSITKHYKNIGKPIDIREEKGRHETQGKRTPMLFKFL